MEVGKFSFYRSFYDAVRGLPPAERLGMYDAMADFAFRDEEPGFENPMLTMAWTLIRPLIESSKRGQVNGAKGGNGRGNSMGENPPQKTPLKPPLKTPPENPIGKEIEKEGEGKTHKGFTHPPSAGAGVEDPAPRGGKEELQALFAEAESLTAAQAATVRARAEHDEMVASAVPCPAGLNPFGGAS